MKNVLVIAITRLGDLIQTEPFLRALKRKSPGARVTLLVERSFLGIANRLVGADRVLAIDFNEVLGTLDESHVALPLAQYIGLVNELTSNKFDEVWNVTHNRPAMVLTTLIGGDRVQGVAIDKRGLQIVRNEWLTYFFATNLARPWCAFNLIDIYVNSADSTTPFAERIPRLRNVSSAPRKVPSDLRHAHVLLHPGASQSDKQWPVDRFRNVAQWLLERGAVVTLIGGRKEQKLESEFPAHRNLSSLIGRTNEDELISACQAADLLVSADSGPVHVAAACGTPVIAIEGGSAHGHETAPYNVNSVVLQSHLEDVLTRVPRKDRASASASLIPAHCVISAIESMSGAEGLPEMPANVAAYRTAEDSRHNSLRLSRVAGGPVKYDQRIESLRQFWHAALNARIQETSRASISEVGLALDFCANRAAAISESRDDFDQTERHASELTSAERRLTRLFNKKPFLVHINAFLQIARSSVPGEDPWTQAASLSSLYRRLAAAEVDGRVLGVADKSVQTKLEIEEML